MTVSAAEVPGAAEAPSRAHSATEKAAAYALYALAFSAPDDALREVVAENRGPWALPAGEPGALILEHTRLFVGPGPVPAPPYGSVYHDGPVLMGESTMDALRHYREAGFALAPGADVLPDHVVAELSFLSVLAEEEARAWADGDAGAARIWMGRRGAFLCDHLAAWAPELCRRMLGATSEPFYVALGTMLRELVAADLEELRAAVAEPTPLSGR
jgi:TorA maturation chaperone TorD